MADKSIFLQIKVSCVADKRAFSADRVADKSVICGRYEYIVFRIIVYFVANKIHLSTGRSVMCGRYECVMCRYDCVM